MSDLRTKFVEANGLRFEVLEEGTGDKYFFEELKRGLKA
jgi:hypothetical protein